jgi:hypothetical protein
MKNSNAGAAAKMYKMVMRHFTQMQIFEKKKINSALFRYRNMEVEDLFIDIKLDFKNEEELALFDLAKQSSQSQIGSAKIEEEEHTEGMVQKTMPYFLTS